MWSKTCKGLAAAVLLAGLVWAASGNRRGTEN